MKHYKILLVLLVSILLFSCREENPAVFNPQDQQEFNSWDDVFESFWNGMNYSYAFWDVDPTDWDAVYREYKPRFQNLEFWNSQDSVTVKKLFTEMTENLIDHHYNLTLKKGDNTEWFNINPGYEEVKKRGYCHNRFSEENIRYTVNINLEKERIKNLVFGEIRNQDNSINFNIFSYEIDNSIVYLRLNAFKINSFFNNPQIIKPIQNFLQLIETVPNLKGIVIDTRNNLGGSIFDIYYFLSPLTSKAITFGYTRTKNGMGRLDYTPWSPMILYPVSMAGGDFTGMEEKFPPVKRNLENVPIVALADIYSGSMGEITPMAIRALPNGHFIGERTWGGHGPLDSDNLQNHYAGTFENKAFQINTSTSLTKNLDGNIYEGIGLTPDIEALYNEAEFLNGNDTQLERAIQFITTGK